MTGSASRQYRKSVGATAPSPVKKAGSAVSGGLFTPSANVRVGTLAAAIGSPVMVPPKLKSLAAGMVILQVIVEALVAPARTVPYVHGPSLVVPVRVERVTATVRLS